MNGFRIFTVLAVVVTAAIAVGTVLLGARDAKAGQEEAILAGGCFWCIESPYDELDGVVEAVSGYTGGSEEDASYKKVSTGRTGHFEAVRVRYDPSKISYRQLLQVFWKHIDPTDPGGQFADRGSQYRTAIFYENEMQRRLAETTKAELALSGKFDRPIATMILPAKPFYPAEEYHQDYCKKNETHYESYFAGSGRKGFLERHWGDMKTPWVVSYRRPPDAEIKKRLTPEEYHVTCGDGTERPFENAFWSKKDEGIYVDVISGEPLFSSTDKFKSGTGWPSFFRPLEPDNIVGKTDRKLGYVRDEVRSRHGDSHLGHVFDDGPKPTGLRYCINSAALRFIPKEALMKEGYGQYLHLFRTEKDDDAKK